MLRRLRSVQDILWTLGLTLLGQPTHPGPSRADRQNIQAKQAELKRRAHQPVTFGQVVRSALVTAAQVLSNQPAPRPVRKSDHTPGNHRR